MKSINELTLEKVERVRRDPWNEYAHIEIQYSDKFHGPWVTVRDVYDAKKGSYFEEQFLIMEVIPDFDAEEWEPWTPPEDYKRIYPDKEFN